MLQIYRPVGFVPLIGPDPLAGNTGGLIPWDQLVVTGIHSSFAVVSQTTSLWFTLNHKKVCLGKPAQNLSGMKVGCDALWNCSHDRFQLNYENQRYPYKSPCKGRLNASNATQCYLFVE